MMLFNFVPLTVTDNTDHFNLQEESAYGSIERVSFRMPFGSSMIPSDDILCAAKLAIGNRNQTNPELVESIVSVPLR